MPVFKTGLNVHYKYIGTFKLCLNFQIKYTLSLEVDLSNV